MVKGQKRKFQTEDSTLSTQIESIENEIISNEGDGKIVLNTSCVLLKDTMDLNDINFDITGLSSTKITHHILTNKIQPFISNMWCFYLNHFLPPSVHSLENSQELSKYLSELYTLVSMISWDQPNTIKSLKSLPLLLLDLLKVSLLYLSTTNILSSTQPVEMMGSISIQLLQEHRLEKHCDLLIQDLPVLLWSFEHSLTHIAEQSSPRVAPYLLKLFGLLETYAISYPNRKKLFLNGTTILLQPCLSLYSTLLEIQHAKWVSDILQKIDTVLSKVLFDDIHHIEELAQIPLTIFVNQRSGHINSRGSNNNKQNQESSKESTSKKQKVSEDKLIKQPLQSYHMSFYNILTDWIYSSSDNSIEQLLPALPRFLNLYFKASFEITNLIERNSTFVQKWRLHIKRILHVGLGLIYCICGDLTDDSVPLSCLKFRNGILYSLNQGLSGETEDGLQIGAIPDHELLNYYVHKLEEVTQHLLIRSLQSSVLINDMSDTKLNTLLLDIIFLRHSVELDCRIVSDKSLNLALRIVGNVYSCRNKRTNSLEGEAMKLFLKYLVLYGDLRRIDVFIRSIFEDISAHGTDKAFSTVLRTAEVQSMLNHIFGTMADEQRNNCWEALLLSNIRTTDEKYTSVESCSFILAPLGLSVAPYRPVPESLMLQLLSQVSCSLSMVIAQLKSETFPQIIEDISGLLLLTSILMKIGHNFLSSSSFATTIPRYPYPISNSAVDDSDNQTASVEDFWIVFCLICSQFLFEVPPEYIDIAKDRLSVDVPFSTSNMTSLCVPKLIEHILRDSQSNFSLISLESVLSSIIDVAFTDISLLSVSSVQFSPLMQRGLEVDSTDPINASCVFSNFFKIILSDSGRSAILIIFETFIHHSLFSRFPILCRTIMNHFENWGTFFNAILRESNPSAITLIDQFTNGLTTAIFMEEQYSSYIATLFSEPKIQDYPFLLRSAGAVCQKNFDRMIQVNNFEGLSRLLPIMCSLPTIVFAPEWNSIISLCSSVLIQLYKGCHLCILENCCYSLSLMLHITADILLNEPQKSSLLFSVILDSFRNSCLIPFGDLVSAILIRDVACQGELLNNFEKLVALLTSHCLTHSADQAILFALFLCPTNASFVSPVEHLIGYLIKEMRISFENPTKFGIIFKILKNVTKTFLKNWSECIQETDSVKVENLKCQLLEIISFITNSRNVNVDAFYYIAGDLCLMLFCLQLKECVVSDLNENEILNNGLQSLAYPQTIPAGHGWIHFFSSFLSWNGKTVSPVGYRYLTLSSTTLSVQNLITSIELSVLPETIPLVEYTLQVEELLRILHSVIKPNLRERMILHPIVAFIRDKYPNGSTFAFKIFEALLQIGFCEWQDCSPASDYHQNYKKYIISNLCTYCERVIPNESAPVTNSSTFLNQIKIASNLYQLQLKMINVSRIRETKKSQVDELTRRQFEGILTSVTNHSIVMFLSLSTARLLSLVKKFSPDMLVQVLLSLIHLLIEFLSSTNYPQLNSNAGIIILIIRQLLVMTLFSLTSITDTSHRTSSIDALRLIGRILMVLSSNKHLQRHSHLFIACIIDVLSGFATIQQYEGTSRITITSSTSTKNEMITISIHNEILRENLFPGLFALLDKCKTSKERKQIFSILDERSRLLYHDLYFVYQQDYKFIGKA